MKLCKCHLIVLVSLCLVSCDRHGAESKNTETRRDTQVVLADSILANGKDDPSQYSSGTKPSTEPDQNKSGWKTYVDDEYGFSIEFPPGLQVRKGFETVHLLSKSWRAMATPEQRGTAIISIPITRQQNNQSFPRYYAVDLRIGVSSGSGEDCAASNGERSIGAITLNGVTFDQYEFSDAAMMQYVSGISYRTDHRGRCFAIEQIRNGSSYADQKSSQDIPQSVLDSCYYLAGKIVRTFKFIR